MLTASRSPCSVAHVSAANHSPVRGWRLRFVSLALLMLGAIGVGRAGAEEFNFRDLQHEVLVRSELAKDARLLPLNLIVRVQDRVATLSGPVPSRDLARRALEAVRKLPDVREVRDEMTVQFEDLYPLLPVPGTIRKPALPALSPPAVADEKKATPPAGTWMPVETQVVRQAAHGAPLPAVDALYGVAEPVSRPKGAVPTAPDASAISSAVQRLMLGEDRYRRLRYELKQGEVYLSGVVTKWSDMQDLARSLMHIPGVNRVVLRDVDTEQAPK